jgi:FMN-dependent NADH-azoreductase
MRQYAIEACAHYLGVARKDIHTIAIEYQEFKDERWRASVTAAEAATRELVDRLLATREAVKTAAE